jgi:polar amino acid transport system permease protein
MTAMGCLIGFGLAFVLVYLRQTPGLWALPLRA